MGMPIAVYCSLALQYAALAIPRMADMHGGITFFGPVDRRAAQRLPLRFEVRWRPYGTGRFCPGTSIDISSDGMAMAGNCDRILLGTLLEVQIIIPSLHGVLEWGGVLGCVIEVIRVAKAQSGPGHVLAGRFCTRPRLVAVACT